MTTALCLLAGCNQSEPDTQTIRIDGSETQLKIRDGSPQALASAAAAIKQVLETQQAQSHAWKKSELSTTNSELASNSSASISKNNLHLLEISKPLYVASDSY